MTACPSEKEITRSLRYFHPKNHCLRWDTMTACPRERSFQFLAQFKTFSSPLRLAHSQFSKVNPSIETVSILMLLFHPLDYLFRQFLF
jgi:hypothetical protein